MAKAEAEINELNQLSFSRIIAKCDELTAATTAQAARIAELEAKLEAARNALIKGESEAFSAIEMGDGYGSAKEFRENAVNKVFEILSVKRVCFGCGNVRGECVCGVG